MHTRGVDCLSHIRSQAVHTLWCAAGLTGQMSSSPWPSEKRIRTTKHNVQALGDGDVALAFVVKILFILAVTVIIAPVVHPSVC